MASEKKDSFTELKLIASVFHKFYILIVFGAFLETFFWVINIISFELHSAMG